MKSSILLSLGLFLCVFTISTEVAGSRLRWRTNRCRRPIIDNGITRIKSRGRVARYRCRKTYQLYGSRFNTCLGRKWLDPHSVCVKGGCRTPDEPDHGHIMTVLRNKVMMFGCSPGFALKGHQVMFCDGHQWNGTEPLCQVDGDSDVILECDFETEELCGWTHGQAADFQWTWNTGNTPSVDMYTGPSHDHTRGAGERGHYMYIEASDPRKENDTARLFSPVFPAAQSGAACFSFWYHMWGSSVGSLLVYIVPVDEAVSDLEPSWQLSQSMGDQWLKVVLPVTQQQIDFQVVIEGVRGENYMSDSAVDDVALQHGDDCVVPPTTARPATASTTVSANAGMSCQSRCDQRADATSCGCTNECMLDMNCCQDYFGTCVEEDGVADDDSGATGRTSSTSGNTSSNTSINTSSNTSGNTSINTAGTPGSPTDSEGGLAGVSSTATPASVASSEPPRTISSVTSPPPQPLGGTSRGESASTATTPHASSSRPPRPTTKPSSTTIRPPTTSRAPAMTVTISQTASTPTPTSATPAPTTTTPAPTTTTAAPTRTPQAPSITTLATTVRITAPLTTATPGRPSSSTAASAATSPDSQPPWSEPPPATSTAGHSGGQPTGAPTSVSPSPPPTTTDLPNELPPLVGDYDNALPAASRSSSADAAGGLPLYAVAALAAGGLLVLVAVVAAVVACRHRRRRARRRPDPLGDDDSLVFFAEPDGEEPPLDLRLRSRPTSVASRPAPQPPAVMSATTELDDFTVEAFCDGDSSETARLTGN